MKAARIITHRGLDPSKPVYFAESSREAFADFLSRGYGLEFDLRLTKDKQIIVMHDANLKRMTSGKDGREIQEVSLVELLAMDFFGSHLISFRELLLLVAEQQSAGTISAVHIKYDFQNPEALDAMLTALEGADVSKIIFFDVKIDTAQSLKERNPALVLAASVAHQYDIERYSNVTGGTLYSLNEVIARRDLFDWVWLDEWDRKDVGGGKKKLYTKEVFDQVHEAGMKIALVMPELHGTSLGLSGGEAHEDAQNHDALMNRIRDILALAPDAICTDYPDEVRASL